MASQIFFGKAIHPRSIEVISTGFEDINRKNTQICSRFASETGKNQGSLNCMVCFFKTNHANLNVW